MNGHQMMGFIFKVKGAKMGSEEIISARDFKAI